MCEPLLCVCGHGVCVHVQRVCSMHGCVRVCESVHVRASTRATFRAVAACWDEHVHVSKFSSSYLYLNVTFTSIISHSQAGPVFARLQALLGHSSSITSTSTRKSTDGLQILPQLLLSKLAAIIVFNFVGGISQRRTFFALDVQPY